MRPAFSARRRSDEFEALVSGDHPPLTERDARQFAALLAVVEDLRDIPPVEARPEFVSSLRERLMVAADTALVASATPTQLHTTPRPPRQQRRLAVLLGGAALVGASATVAVAAQSALPGEALYPVKRGLESTQLRFESGVGRGEAELAMAEERLTELEALTAAPDASTPSLVEATLDTFGDQAEGGVRLLLDAYAETGDKSLVESAHDFNATSLGRLDTLADRVPPDASAALEQAGRTLTDLDEEATTACLECTGGIATVPDFLLTSARSGLGELLGLERPAGSTPMKTRSGQDTDGLVVPGDLLTPRQQETTTQDQTTGTNRAKDATGRVKDTVRGTADTLTGTGDKVKDAVEDNDTVGDKVKDTVKDTVGATGDTVDDTVDDVTDLIDEVTGGTLHDVTGTADDVTGGTLDEVDGTVDDVTGGTLDGVGGLLP